MPTTTLQPVSMAVIMTEVAHINGDGKDSG